MKKGQYFSFDALVGSLMFLTALTVLFSFWSYSVSASNTDVELMRKEAIRISSLLISNSEEFGIVDDMTSHRLLSITSDGETIIDLPRIEGKISNVTKTTRYCLIVRYFEPASQDPDYLYVDLNPGIRCSGNLKSSYTIYRAITLPTQAGYVPKRNLEITLGVIASE